MLARASSEKMLANKPSQIITFVSTAEEALEEAERQVALARQGAAPIRKLKLKGTGRWWKSAAKKIGGPGGFMAGVFLGAVVATQLARASSSSLRR